MKLRCNILLLLAYFCSIGVEPLQAQKAFFTNPIVQSGADPWMIHKDGWYYFTSTEGNRVDIRRSKSFSDLASAKPVTIWKAPASGANSRDVWAPEFHWVKDRWFVYFTATTEDRSDINRRIFVLESLTDDLQGQFTERGQLIMPGEDYYAIDGTLFQAENGKLYFLWSGRQDGQFGAQNIYIAPMSNPWTICGPRVLLSTPEHAWEKHGWAVNEGPEVLQRNGTTFVVYSASGFTTTNYCLGLLVNTNSDLLNPSLWKKSPAPVFTGRTEPERKTFGPGHNSFFKSPDAKEDWIIYHARDTATGTPRERTARAHRFTWKPDGTPNFGEPVSPGEPIAIPSGE